MSVNKKSREKENNIKAKAIRKLKKEIEFYLRQIEPRLLGLAHVDSIEILNLIYGSRNLNFHIRVNQKDLNFRVNIEQRRWPIDQSEYEYNVLKFLAPYKIAPQPYHFDKTKQYFNFGIIIQAYLKGSYLKLDSGRIWQTAELLAKLHSIPIKKTKFLVWKNPLKETWEMAERDLVSYASKANSDEGLVRMARDVLNKTAVTAETHSSLFQSDCLNHKDVVCDNIIQTTDGLKLIDWEKPGVDDCTYDICCILSHPAQLWCSQKTLPPKDLERFIDTYTQLTGKNKDLLMEKVKIRQSLVSLHWILWAAIKLCDFRSQHTVSELVEAHQQRVHRFEAVACLENIEKILDTVS
jgi:thiamine kinase-like enzyme